MSASDAAETHLLARPQKRIQVGFYAFLAGLSDMVCHYAVQDSVVAVVVLDQFQSH
eukprot:CAMPEP_0202704100 /NCGR_PEP_ID=MMETSP1385-20130828/16849_1 /ASSEMBLY_ACC=CAM_ASM_000861 /TAXON_ID=933848 /ORGANISM="Elphidium margaritaceum" /LENGTH=55 /DNA_ID=CAMNT_0049362053 /DNA_START=712 /DNA_END=879 /DNA_ORIENTATION=-